MTYQEFITKYKTCYDIMLLREQENKTFLDIAHLFNVSVSCIRAKYVKIKNKQYKVYLSYLTVKTGDVNLSSKMKLIEEFYFSTEYTVAYLEQEYKEILDAFRKGEPSTPVSYLNSFPSYRIIDEATLTALIIKEKEVKKQGYVQIGVALSLTEHKVKQMYNWHHHVKVLHMMKLLQPKMPDINMHEFVFGAHVNETAKSQLKRLNELQQNIDKIDDA